MFDKKQNMYVKCIHFVTDDGLYDGKTFYKVKNCFYSSSMNDNEFINYPNISLLDLMILYEFCKTFQWKHGLTSEVKLICDNWTHLPCQWSNMLVYSGYGYGNLIHTDNCLLVTKR